MFKSPQSINVEDRVSILFAYNFITTTENSRQVKPKIGEMFFKCNFFSTHRTHDSTLLSILSIF
jgi:hypothetical protein